MTVFLFILGLVECALLHLLAMAGVQLGKKEAREQEMAKYAPPGGWPRCALIIPVAGSDPRMEPALRSLLEQDYPGFETFIITREGDEAPLPLIRMLVDEYPGLRHGTAKTAGKCGQKNLNLLTGVAMAGPDCEILAFCDSTHIARHDFLRCLTRPLACDEANFTTGYHIVEPKDSGTTTLGYALSVLFMRFMQAMGSLTQPWGGALAMKRATFEEHDVAKLWQTNVVDDCSLAAHLQRSRIRARLCPGATLVTTAANHALDTWSAWMQRQILFLKFCIPGQWIALGIAIILLLAPPLWALAAMCAGVLGLGGGMPPFLAMCWSCLIFAVMAGWRRFLPFTPGIWLWMTAFFCACALFTWVYLRTIFARGITWSNTTYRVGSGGVVQGIERNAPPFDRGIDAK